MIQRTRTVVVLSAVALALTACVAAPTGRIRRPCENASGGAPGTGCHLQRPFSAEGAAAPWTGSPEFVRAQNDYLEVLKGGQGDDADREARLFWKSSCDAGFASACLHLGGMWQYGFGGPRDAAQANVHYSRACELGFAQACDMAVEQSGATGETASPTDP